MKLPTLRSPYLLVLLLLLVFADIGGVVHAFRRHGRGDGAIAIVLPPYGLYRAVEALQHPQNLSPEEMAKTDYGRRELAKGLHLKPEVWDGLLRLVNVQKNQTIRSTMEDSGITFDIAVTVPATGAISLTIQPQTDTKLTIGMTDENRDQTPEMLQITKVVDGKPEVHNTEIAKYASEDASQFLLAWTLAWGTIAEEQKAAVVQPTSK